MDFPLRTGYKFRSGYGSRIDPITGVRSGHNGVDYSAPSGTPIYAPDSGIVSGSSYSSSSGNYVLIKHDNGYTTGYAHMVRPGIKKGKRVRRGDVIGNVGTTGRSTGNHLHLTLRNKKGSVIDPHSINWKTATARPKYLVLVPSVILLGAGSYFLYQSLRK